jgi:hypothetical protein
MIKKFNEFYLEGYNNLTEDAMATAGNTGGMGAVVAPSVGSIPGECGSKGSGDLACELGSTCSKIGASGFNPTKKKKKKTKKYSEFIKSNK